MVQPKGSQMDELDRAIVAQLKEDGRKPFTAIARELGVSEGTVRNRVGRMIDDRVLHIVGEVDPYKMGLDAPALIGLTLKSDEIEPAMEAIASLEEVSYLLLVSGEFDAIVEVFCRDREHLADFLTKELRQIPGVEGTRTFTILRTYKMAYGTRPILPIE
jgi:Lrp/AsnC family transcriptional regulator for asnA, asnC and gidA